jgi:hypothetical protein
LSRIPVEARIWLVTTSPSPPQSGGEGRGEVARIKSPLSGSLPAQSRGERVVVATPSEVREKFKRVKPLGEIKGSAPAPGAASDALVAQATAFGFGARARRTTAGAAVLPISPANWNGCILITPKVFASRPACAG